MAARALAAGSNGVLTTASKPGTRATTAWSKSPHHNTYDIEFWGPDGMCTSFYLGALQAAVLMGQALGRGDVPLYCRASGQAAGARAESELFNGEYFIQRIQWKGLRARRSHESPSMGGGYSPEALALFEKEGPKYQYGAGCLSDGVLGAWLALVCGVGAAVGPGQSHQPSPLGSQIQLQTRPLCFRQSPAPRLRLRAMRLVSSSAPGPKAAHLSLPFPYSNEVWTGIEYQSASHMMRMGLVQEGLQLVRACRDRYDGRVRNPFNEYECGHWYARAMSSYALLFGLSGARYDAVEKTLHLDPRLGGDFRSFFSTASGYGTVGLTQGKPFYEPKAGSLEIRQIILRPAA